MNNWQKSDEIEQMKKTALLADITYWNSGFYRSEKYAEQKKLHLTAKISNLFEISKLWSAPTWKKKGDAMNIK